MTLSSGAVRHFEAVQADLSERGLATAPLRRILEGNGDLDGEILIVVTARFFRALKSQRVEDAATLQELLFALARAREITGPLVFSRKGDGILVGGSNNWAIVDSNSLNHFCPGDAPTLVEAALEAHASGRRPFAGTQNYPSTANVGIALNSKPRLWNNLAA